MESNRHRVRVIPYGSPLAHLFLWQKAFLLSPVWAIPIILLFGFASRGMGNTLEQLGYSLMVAACTTYLIQDTLKRKIRLDDEYIFFGFKAIPIKEILSIDVVYKKKKLLPSALLITCQSGKSLKLQLDGLTGQSIDEIVKHIQARNSTVKTTPMIATLVKCRDVARQPVIDTESRLEMPYHARQIVDESYETFKTTAHKWARVGPVIVFILFGPVWLSWLSSLFFSFSDYSWSEMQSLNMQVFLRHFFEGLQHLALSSAKATLNAITEISKNYIVTISATITLAALVVQTQRLFLKPTRLIADDRGIRLALRLGDLTFTTAGVGWNQICDATLFQPEGQSGAGKIRLTLTSGRKMDIDLSSIQSEHRGRLLKRLEEHISGCQILPEVSQSLLPKQERSYTEIWLQSLTQAPERKSLDPLQPGQTLCEGRYEVIKKLGVGGQGTAYLCRDLDSSSPQTVVLKETILPVFVKESVRREALERFDAEARLLQMLDSERTVKLLDHFVEDHRAYLALEHIDGCSLRELVQKEGPLSEERAREIALQMCQILKLLHSHSIVHRDFTPDNLILNSKGTLKLIDFNVAQQPTARSTGTIVGKHAYLPPEQFRGKATQQSDIYALGATLYYLVTGNDPEPISQSSPNATHPSTSDVLDRIIRTATQLETGKRYQCADEIESELASGDGIVLSARLEEEMKEPLHG